MEPNCRPCAPSATDMFRARAVRRHGKATQNGAKGGYYVRKAAPSCRATSVLVRLFCCKMAWHGDPVAEPRAPHAARSGCQLFLAVDAVGISRCRIGRWLLPMMRRDPNSISAPYQADLAMIHRQGYETYGGGERRCDGISVAQSMRAYLQVLASGRP